jgi:hypothetical protein
MGRFLSEFVDHFSESPYLVNFFRLFYWEIPTSMWTIPINCSNNASAVSDLLNTFGLNQHIRGPKHQKGHTLDLVITRFDAALIWSTVSPDLCISDHYPVFTTLAFPKVTNHEKEISYRKIKAINKDELAHLIDSSQLTALDDSALDEMVTKYDQELRKILDTVAPLRAKKIRIRVNAEWYNDVIRSEKQSRRRAERRWLKTKSYVDQASYKTARLKVNEMIDEAKRAHYQGKVSACDGDPKKLFRVVDTLLGKSTASPLPV